MPQKPFTLTGQDSAPNAFYHPTVLAITEQALGPDYWIFCRTAGASTIGYDTVIGLPDPSGLCGPAFSV